MRRKFPRLRRLALGLVLGASAAWLQSAAVAAEERPLDAPRAQGLIGERYDGFAVVHDQAASPEVRALVEKTNGERRKVYANQAQSSGAPVAEIGKIYAAQIGQKAPVGTWLQGADGKWMQK